MSLTTKIFIGLIAGIVAGLALAGAPDFVDNFIAPIGSVFINMIGMVIVPLVFSSLIVGAASIGDAKTLGRIGGKTLAYYLFTTAFAVSIGLLLGKLINPGAGLSIPTDAAAAAASEAPKLVDTIVNMIPRNPLQGLVSGSMLQIIVFALFLGVGFTAVPGDKGKPFINFFDSLAEIMYKITAMIMNFAPYGVFGLITPVVAKNGPAVLLPLIKVVIAVYLGCIIHAVLVYSSAVSVVGKISPMKFFKAIAPAAITAFSTTSSAGTLPVTMKSCKEGLGVSDKIASFVLPLGATINMDGTALYQGVCALFVAQVYGVALTGGQIGTIILTATLASIGTAGVPGAGLIMLSLVLTSVGLPLEGVALIAGIDRVLDMARTTVNIVGDASCAVVIAATENELDVPREEVTV
ncbi:sodium:dicarboxylate symporter [Alkaliphilus metalliredigens QYMF]|uniref:Sodium:dicarboxylate symporter n=2 Tax=Alkaliphilus TaxID=114627 RepID=A6TSZ6_ALKMQ|nr:sodium:dicarboxylate symporter [Alkaliphilus metalliredigens QYMF]